MAKSDAQVRTEGGFSYFRESRSFSLSIISILPLIVLYHFGIVQSGSPQRNLAEVWLTGPLQLVGLQAAHVLNIALVVALVAVLWRSERSPSLNWLIVIVMVAEAMLYAALLYKGGPALAGTLNQKASRVFFAANLGRTAPLLLALGAGVYEELCFRLLLVGGGSWLLHHVCRWNASWSVGVMLVGSSLLFAAVHHIGPLGEPLESYNFFFRTVCGLLLGVVFLARGLGVAVWTHAIYNALVMLQHVSG